MSPAASGRLRPSLPRTLESAAGRPDARAWSLSHSGVTIAMRTWGDSP